VHVLLHCVTSANVPAKCFFVTSLSELFIEVVPITDFIKEISFYREIQVFAFSGTDSFLLICQCFHCLHDILKYFSYINNLYLLNRFSHYSCNIANIVHE